MVCRLAGQDTARRETAFHVITVVLVFGHYEVALSNVEISRSCDRRCRFTVEQLVELCHDSDASLA